jgi:hypothetical protein
MAGVEVCAVDVGGAEEPGRVLDWQLASATITDPKPSHNRTTPR